MKSKTACGLTIALAIIAGISGCEKGPDKSSIPSAETTPDHSLYANLKDSDVLVSVNGLALTKGQVEETCQIQATLASLARKKQKPDQIERMKNRLRATAVKTFALRRAVLEEAERRAVKLSETEFAQFCESFAKGFSQRSKKDGYGSLTNKLTAQQAKALDQDLRRDCVYRKVFADLRAASRVSITEEEANQKFEKIKAYNLKADAAERAVFMEATNVWNRLNMGEKFEEAVARLSGRAPRVDTDMNWGTFQKTFFEKDDPAIYTALKTMKKGEYTPPILGNGGLLIFKILDITPPSNPSDLGGDYYQLAQIFFQLPEKYNLENSEEVRKELVEELSKDKLEAELEKLKAKLKIEYPNGKILMSEHKHN